MIHDFKMYVGPMFGGKTTRMLSQVERYSYMGEEALIFKPKIDERYESKSIVTHSGKSIPAIRVQHGDDIRRAVSAIYGGTPSVIAIDEAFMIPGSGFAAVQLFREGHTILVSSLQLASDGSPFEEIQMMFPFATYISVCPAVDPISKRDAYYTEKIGGKQESGAVEVGGSEMYRPRDWHGFFGSDR